MRHLVAVIFILMSVAVSANGSCFVITPSARGAYESARAVFIGEVVKITEPVSTGAGLPLRDRLYKLTFNVEYSWKGAGFREIGLRGLVVYSGQGRTGQCIEVPSSPEFIEGRKYLVYANETSEKDLIITYPSRVMPLALADDDLRELRRLESQFVFEAQPRFRDFPLFSW